MKILPRDKPLATRIGTAVLASPINVKTLMSTPLLATLLTIVYRAHQRVPADFAEFYDELFQILLVRHDRSKSGYERKRKTKLSDREFQQVFEAFAYKSKSEGLSSMGRAKARDLSAAAIKVHNLECDETHFLADISKVTCLLQEEGDRIEFLHQSVQEFFAARYVASRPDELASRFYSLLITQRKRAAWDQVLRFLAQIDKFRSYKYFYIPALRATLKHLESSAAVGTPERLTKLVADKIGVRQQMTQLEGAATPVARYGVFILDAKLPHRMDWVHNRLYNLLFGPKGIANSKWQACFDKQTDGQVVTYATIAVKCGVEKLLQEDIANSVQRLFEEATEMELQVRQMADASAFMGI